MISTVRGAILIITGVIALQFFKVQATCQQVPPALLR